MKTVRLALALALSLGATAAAASSLSISPAAATAQPGAGNPTVPTPINVAYDNTGYAATDGDAIDAEVHFDATKLSVSVTGSCVATGGNSSPVIIALADGFSNRIASGNLCVMTFTTLAGAALGDVIPLTFQNVSVSSNGAADAVQPTLTPGAITIAAAPPADGPVLTYSPATGSTLVSGADITVTPSGGEAGGSSTYTCVAPAGVTVTNNPGAISTGGAAATLDVSCPAGTADASMTCTSTGGGASVTYNVDCPAVPAPVLSSTPANGTPLACNGTPGTTQTVSATITNSGNADMTGVACTTTGTGFSIQTAPSPTIAGGASSPVTVACVVPATGTNVGTLNCTTTAPAGGALAFPLSSAAQSAAVPPQAAIVPASSLWSQLGLVGLLAVLGMLVVGFRRQH